MCYFMCFICYWFSPYSDNYCLLLTINLTYGCQLWGRKIVVTGEYEKMLCPFNGGLMGCYLSGNTINIHAIKSFSCLLLYIKILLKRPHLLATLPVSFLKNCNYISSLEQFFATWMRPLGHWRSNPKQVYLEVHFSKWGLLPGMCT